MPEPSTYDRGRMLQDREQRGAPRSLESMREVGWEHQAEAMARGYPSVLHWAIDLLVERSKELEARLEVLEQRWERAVSLGEIEQFAKEVGP